MAIKCEIKELQRLVTAISQLHVWQGDLLAQATKVLQGASDARASEAAPHARGRRRYRGDASAEKET